MSKKKKPAKKKPVEKTEKPCFDLSLLLKSYEELPEFEFDFTLSDYDFELHLEDYDFDFLSEKSQKVSPDS